MKTCRAPVYDGDILPLYVYLYIDKTTINVSVDMMHQTTVYLATHLEDSYSYWTNGTIIFAGWWWTRSTSH